MALRPVQRLAPRTATGSAYGAIVEAGKAVPTTTLGRVDADAPIR